MSKDKDKTTDTTDTTLYKVVSFCVMAGIFLYIFIPHSATTATKSVGVTVECTQNLRCMTKSNMLYATLYCEKALNQLPRWQHKWDDKYSIFTMSQWTDKSRGIITYKGSGIRISNGFGGWRQASYYCTYDTANKQVLNARMW